MGAASSNVQPIQPALWELVRVQHGVVTKAQLRALGFGAEAVRHRVATGRLHPVMAGVYAVGRPRVGRRGRWLAAVLSCGPGAVLSHEGAAALWQMQNAEGDRTEVSVPASRNPRRPGLLVYRRQLRPEHVTRRRGIPVTTPACTLVDLATRLSQDRLEAAVNEADKRDLTDPEALRSRLVSFAGWPGSGFKVDFCRPGLGLIVETDGLRYHRTPAQQTRDRLRDQAHAAAGLTTLRFTHAQVAGEPEQVAATLRAVARRLQAAHGAAPGHGA